jgi:hypothetical protein
MTTPEIERLLTATLHAQAEDAMNDTDTQTQLDILHRESARHPRGGRAVGLVAAAAVVAALVWWQGTDDATVIEPTPPVDVPTQTEELATNFVEAWADFDRARVASYIAKGATLKVGADPGSPESWRVLNRWDQATGWAVQVEPCRETFTPGNTIQVACAYSGHLLGSQQLGRGPYENNVFLVTVENGKVVHASQSGYSYLLNGPFDDEMWIPFRQWMDDEHPADAQVMDAYTDAASTAAEIDASLQLWEQRTQEYVDAVRAGETE